MTMNWNKTIALGLIVLAAAFAVKCFMDREEMDDLWDELDLRSRTVRVAPDAPTMMALTALEQEVDMLRIRVDTLEEAMGLENGELKWAEIKHVAVTNSVCD